ncbi:MAG: PAS domain S-box protein, partial [Myxococcota bacterium]
RRAGAHDFVLKDGLNRLVPVVERELREADRRAQQRATERAHRRQEARFRAIIEKADDVVLLADRQGTILYASPAVKKVLGYEPDALVGQSGAVLMHPDDAARSAARYYGVIDGTASSRPEPRRARRADGGEVWVEIAATNLLDEPDVGAVVVHLRDLTDRRRAMAELEASERRYRRIIETTSEGVALIDASGHATFVNRRLTELLGWAEGADIIGKRFADLVDARGRGAFLGVMMALREVREPAQIEVPLSKRDGTTVWVLIEATGIFGEDGRHEGYLAMLADLTERRRAEEARRRAEEALSKSSEQLRHAQKMEAIGRLAGGVAHDFNNLLTVILSYGTMVAAQFASDDPVAEDLGELVTAARRAAELTRQLLMFSRQQVVQPQTIDVNDVVSGIERMCQRILGEDITLVTALGSDPGLVLIDPGLLEQVLMNLVVNARDAMPAGGRLTMETTSLELDETFAAEHLGITPGPHVLLAVSDTGCGMDRETQARIFEPFFTTKEAGKGTGLGLSTVFGIVQQARGSVWVYSEPGHGTTFKVYLPRVDLRADRQPTTGPRPHVPPGTETVLLVEDEDQVRRIVAAVLRQNGYQVIDTRRPSEALAKLAEHEGVVDLLVTDVVMPEMSGPQLAKQLRELRPGLKVLCVSGYADEAIVGAGLIDAGVAFLQKPLVPEALLRKVREVLSS